MTHPGTADYLPPKINRYLNLQCDANVSKETGLARAYFGALPAGDADAILDGKLMVNGSAVTGSFTESQAVSTAKYGQALQCVASSTNTRAVTFHGRDYLGQPVTETITLTSDTTVYGKKAFAKVDSYSFASASDTTTVDVGFAELYGMPYANLGVLEEVVDGVIAPRSAFAPLQLGPVYIDATALAAGTSRWVVSPIRGFVTRLTSAIRTTIGTGGELTVEIGGDAVVGLSNVIADSATAGTVVTDTPTDLRGESGRIGANAAIELVGDADFATAGDLEEYVEVTPATSTTRTNVTQTATTDDPRGLFDPNTTPDGTKVFEAIMLVDMNNTNGFYGVAHYTA